MTNEVIKDKNEKKEKLSNKKTNTLYMQYATKPNESIITDTKLDEEETEENSQIIQNFVQYCNENKIEQAYSLLSDACKEELYNNINIFTNNYVNKIFKTQKTYQLELWAGHRNYHTYRITYLEGNLLQTGGNNLKDNFVDYITIIKQGEDLKLNISKLVNKQSLSKAQTSNNVEININSKAVYIDYEVYNITAKNNTENEILLNDGTTASNICLLDENDNEYNSILNELPTNYLTINSQYSRTFDLKFSKNYNASSQIRYMQIKDIYLNKEKYDLNNNEEIEKVTIKIKL